MKNNAEEEENKGGNGVVREGIGGVKGVVIGGERELEVIGKEGAEKGRNLK